MTTTQEHAEALEKALAAGPTAGEWVLCAGREPFMPGATSFHANVYPKRGGNAICGQKSNRINGRAQQRLADLGYIAAANPDAIRALLDERKKLRAALGMANTALQDYGMPLDCKLSKWLQEALK